MGTTLPVAAIVVAMSAGAASVAVIELTQTALHTQGSPAHIAMLFWPEFGGAMVTAFLLGALFRTRFIPLLAFSGMLMLAGGAAVLAGVTSAPHAVVVIGSGLVGLGVGASVSPALFICGFSIASSQIQRVFAMIELLRGVAAFMVAPVLLHLAMTVDPTPPRARPLPSGCASGSRPVGRSSPDVSSCSAEPDSSARHWIAGSVAMVRRGTPRRWPRGSATRSRCPSDPPSDPRRRGRRAPTPMRRVDGERA